MSLVVRFSIIVTLLAPALSAQSFQVRPLPWRSGPPDLVPIYCSTDLTLDLYRPDKTLHSSTFFGIDGRILTMDRLGFLWLRSGSSELVCVDLWSDPPLVIRSVSLPGTSLGEAAVSPDDKLWVVDNVSGDLLELSRAGSLLASHAINTTQPTLAGVAIAPTQDAGTRGYYAWVTAYNQGAATGQAIRIDPSGTNPDVVLSKSNARVIDVAVGAGGADIWIPIEVGGSGSTDRLDRHDAAGAFVSSSPSTGWTGTYSFSAIVAAQGDIWVAATDGNGSGAFNPKVVFHYDSSGVFTKGWNAAPVANPAGMGPVTLDGWSNLWAGVVQANKLFHVEASSCTSSDIPVCTSGSLRMETTGTGYILANVIYPDLDFDRDGVGNRAELLAGTNPYE